jgi:hypothetical protein
MNGSMAMTRVESGPGLARADRDDGLVMVVSPAEARRRVQELQAFVQEVMVPKVDYDKLPGTDKSTLLQPGAQKLAEMYGFAHDFVDVASVEDWERGFFFYRRKCVLTARRDGRYIGSGIGSCNAREDRYAGRWAFDSEIPPGVNKATLRTKEFQRKNGSGSFLKYRVPNEDIFSLVNTIEKMACKRSYVGAVVAVTRSAGLFTQDVEDLPEEVYGRPDEARSWERDTSPASGGEVFRQICEAIDAAEAGAVLNTIANDVKKAYAEKLLSKADYEAIVKAHAAKGKLILSSRQSKPKPPTDDEPPQPTVEREPGEEG